MLGASRICGDSGGTEVEGVAFDRGEEDPAGDLQGVSGGVPLTSFEVVIPESHSTIATFQFVIIPTS